MATTVIDTRQLVQAVERLVTQHGSLRKVGLELGLDHTYLSRLLKGDKCNPSTATLDKLGLTVYITYKRKF